MSTNNDMRVYHANCLKYLINYQKNHDGFYFVPRKNNNRGRLDMNYYFIGSPNNYMMISFWDGGDSYEKIHNINFGVEYGGHCFIEISSNDNNERATFLEELVDTLNKENKSSLKTNYSRKKNKWRREYNTDIHYIDILQDFINNEKPIIDKYIIANPKSGIKLADENLHEKYVLKLFKKETQTSEEDKKNNKENKGGEVWIDPHAYRMRLQHNELQNALLEYLEDSNDYKDVIKENNNVDISAKTNGQTIFFELKTSEAKYSIREAIGQLLEYNHYSNENKADKLIIVTKFEPKEDDIIYIEFLRKTYDLPIYYQMFDMKESKLSKEY